MIPSYKKRLMFFNTEVPMESEEWTGSVDRGGLIYISEATYQLLVAVENSLRRYLKTSTAHLMDHEFQISLTKKVVADEDVQFNWTIASAAVEEDVMERLLEGITNLYRKWQYVQGNFCR